MKTKENFKSEILSHLEWCMEQLKYKELSVSEDEFEFCYRMLHNISTQIRSMSVEESINFYNHQIETIHIKEILMAYNINLII